MQPEKRKYVRTDIFLIVYFRLLHKSYEYSLGISRNYSDGGFSMESHNFHYKPGQILECTIRHPESETSVSILGEIVWKKDGWYDGSMGIRFLHVDENKLTAIRVLGDAKQVENAPLPSNDMLFKRAHENDIQNMTSRETSPEKTVESTFSSTRKIETPPRIKPARKLRHSYVQFFVFIVLSAVFVFFIASREGEDIFTRANLPSLGTDNALTFQAGMAGVPAPYERAAIIDNNRKLMPLERSHVNTPSNDAAFPDDIIRDTVTFDVNSADISSKFDAVIDKVADILLGNPGLIVLLEGHTDNAGTDIYNMDLSLRRTEAVQRRLINKGIHPSRIKIICFGNASPAASNDLESGRMKNRRVEIAIPRSET